MSSRVLLLAVVASLGAVSAQADSLSINFENPPYVTGSIHGQDGWSSSGSAGMGCAVYDHRVATNTYGYVDFGGQSLRMSNAVTSGCFGDQTFSKSLLNDAGETTATGDGMTTGLRQSHFEASWQFASTVPGAEQPNLSVVASPDRGDGARMSWVQMFDAPDGLQVNFYDYQDLPPYGSDADPDPGCGTEDDFFFTNAATGLDRTVPHTVKVTMDFVEGSRNDIVKVYVDGVLKHAGTSWEDYFRYCEGNPTRPVDSVLFRTGGAAAPANAGKGFVVDNLSLSSSARPVRMDLRPNNSTNQVNTGAKQLVPVALLGEAGFDPVTDVDTSSVTMHGGSPLSTKFDTNDVNGDGYRDLTLYFRARDLDSPTTAECGDPNARIRLDGSTTAGGSFTADDHVTWLGC